LRGPEKAFGDFGVGREIFASKKFLRSRSQLKTGIQINGWGFAMKRIFILLWGITSVALMGPRVSEAALLTYDFAGSVEWVGFGYDESSPPSDEAIDSVLSDLTEGTCFSGIFTYDDANFVPGLSTGPILAGYGITLADGRRFPSNEPPYLFLAQPSFYSLGEEDAVNFFVHPVSEAGSIGGFSWWIEEENITMIGSLDPRECERGTLTMEGWIGTAPYGAKYSIVGEYHDLKLRETTPVPEPSTIVLFGFGLVGGSLAFRRRIRNREFWIRRG
jgi:hypothetical protein